jgi:hypothetical protein
LAAKAAAEAAAAQPKPPKMVRVAMPRYMQQRTEPKKVLPASKPVRHTTKEGAIKVNWKVSERGWWLCGSAERCVPCACWLTLALSSTGWALFLTHYSSVLCLSPCIACLCAFA